MKMMAWQSGLRKTIGEINKMSFDNLKNYMDELVTRYNVPGVDCIVYKDHEQLFRYYTGYSDLENSKIMNGNEMYLIFSMTKMLTCTAALQLMEKGKYTLKDPVSMYLPEFEKMTLYDGKEAKNPITIKHLFTMSAGLDYALADEAITTALSEGKKSTRDLVGAMANKKLLFEPGTRYRYSLCHDVLGALIEVWSGKKLGEYMKANIFDPIGMKNTFFGVPKDEETLSRTAARYIYDENRKPKRLELACMYTLTDEYESGGAGLTSCAEDYSLFLDTLACGGVSKNGKKILSAPTIELMKTNHIKGAQLDDFHEIQKGYGYGLGVRTHMDKTESGSVSPIGEFGWDGAAGAFSMVDTENHISLTYFQHVHGWNGRIQTEMRNALYADMF